MIRTCADLMKSKKTLTNDVCKCLSNLVQKLCCIKLSTVNLLVLLNVRMYSHDFWLYISGDNFHLKPPYSDCQLSLTLILMFCLLFVLSNFQFLILAFSLQKPPYRRRHQIMVSYFPLILLVTRRNCSFHSTTFYHSRADWDGFCDRIWHVSWENILNLSLKFCEKVTTLWLLGHYEETGFLKVLSAKFLLVCFSNLKESTCETKKKFLFLLQKFFVSTSKTLFVLEKVKV